jgi:hypothetical protein
LKYLGVNFSSEFWSNAFFICMTLFIVEQSWIPFCTIETLMQMTWDILILDIGSRMFDCAPSYIPGPSLCFFDSSFVVYLLIHDYFLWAILHFFLTKSITNLEHCCKI